MSLLGIISFLFGATFSLVLAILKIILIFIIGGTAWAKGYKPWLWAVITLLLPWPFPIIIAFLVFYVPFKVPKLPRSMRQDPAFKDKNPVIASIMALCAMIAKADGNVTKQEIQYIKNYVIRCFGISREELSEYADAFNYGKEHPEQYLAFTDIIFGYYRTQRNNVQALAYLFVGVSLQEGADDETKEAQTRKIIMALGLSEYEYLMIRQFLMNPSGMNSDYSSYQNTGGFGGDAYQPQENLVKKYTQVLGVSEDASMSEIKKAYRKLVKEYHPDKLSAGSVPQEYIDFANQKIRDINEAYEYLEKIKGGK